LPITIVSAGGIFPELACQPSPYGGSASLLVRVILSVAT
jgi:hypothetical protein